MARTNNQRVRCPKCGKIGVRRWVGNAKTGRGLWDVIHSSHTVNAGPVAFRMVDESCFLPADTWPVPAEWAELYPKKEAK